MKHPLLYISIFVLVASSGCKKYLEVPVPINSIAGSTVFDNDYTAAGALNSIFAGLYTQGNWDGSQSVNYLTGLYGDELKNYSLNVSNQAVYINGVSSTLGGVTALWVNLYKQLYSVNLAIEGLTPNDKGLAYRNQWLGEAYFLRGLIYFYLTNTYGEVPLILGSDYLKNNGIGRSAQSDVYKQILSDLQQAQTLLTPEYRDGAGAVSKDRGRPNQAAVAALMARVYLYMQDWKNAATQASITIGNTATYQLINPVQTFLLNNNENIWGLVPSANSVFNYKVKDVGSYVIPSGITPLVAGIGVTLSDSLVKSFEPNDLRYANWVGKDTVVANGVTTVYYYAWKYKANPPTALTAPVETLVMLRLAEQYLIRAEARAQQSDLNGALADLNAVRTRAGLPNSTAVSQPEILTAILKERRVELFTEGAHRYFDLRRTNNLDALMTKLSPLKGGTWEPYKQWWPIPLTDVQNNTNLLQTPNYQ